MLAFSCSFCHHLNPPGSKFCNECGSPLRLTPCLKCQALNEVGSATCHQCGAPLAPRAASPKPAANRAPSFDERLEALRRDFGIPGDPRVETRPVAPANIALASASSVPIIALADRGLGALDKNASTPPSPANSSTTTTSSGIAPASLGTRDAPIRPAPASSIAPAAPADPAPTSFTTTASNAAADRDQGVVSPSGPATIPPAMPTPAEPRRVPPRLLYGLGAGLILVGVAGYMYSPYRAPDRIDQWLGALGLAPARQESAMNVSPQSVALAADATTPSASASGEARLAPPTDDPAMTAPSATARSSSAPMNATALDTAANRVLAPAAAPTIAESPPLSSATRTPPATESAPAAASAAPQVTAASKKHAPRAKRRAKTRKAAPSQSEIAPHVPTSVSAVGE